MKKIVLATTFAFVTAFLSCAKEEGTSGGGSSGGGTVLKKDFSSQKEASERIAGSLNSIVTARIVTARMGTGDSGGGTMAPKLSYIDERLKYHDILVSKLHQKIQRFKIREQQGNGDGYGNEMTIMNVDPCEEFASNNCQALLPRCVSGTAEIKVCDAPPSGNKRSVVAVISVNSCKEIPDESKRNNYFIYNGKAQIFAECSTGTGAFKMGSKFENAKIDYYEADRKVYEFEFSPSISYVSELRIDVEGESLTTSASVSINGNSREKDVLKNIEQRSSFSGFKLYAESSVRQNMTNPDNVTDFTSGITDILMDINFEVLGKYSITTTPQWCGDGEYEIRTDSPIKIKGGEECPYSGKLIVNNSSIQFTGSNKVKITVGNESKEYSCQELYALCPYPLRGPTYLFSDMGGESQ